MSLAATLQAAPAKPRGSMASAASGLLQRRCACGAAKSPLGEVCDECRSGQLQRKIAIGASNDPLELEADRVADQVLAAPNNAKAGNVPPRIQRFTDQSTEHESTAPISVDSVLASSGRPLEPVLRHDMEHRFGHDFSLVRVHTGAAAEQSARDLSAHAYTVGHDIVFGARGFAPETHEGRRILAHELTHVVQQADGPQFLIQRQDIQDQGCDGRVDDRYQLLATAAATPPELSTALIKDRNQSEELPKTYFLGDYLNDYMAIVDIPIAPTNEGIVYVMHCETLERLEYGRPGAPPEPEHITKVQCGAFKAGTVETFNNCQRVQFISDDGSRPLREYILEDGIYWLQDGTHTGYPPSDLEGYLGVHLQGNVCGMLKDCQGSEKGYKGIVPNTLEEFENPEDAYGSAIQEDGTKSGGKLVQYDDGTIEYYNSDNVLQVTHRLYNGQYYSYTNKAIFGGAIDKAVIEKEHGVSIR